MGFQTLKGWWDHPDELPVNDNGKNQSLRLSDADGRTAHGGESAECLRVSDKQVREYARAHNLEWMDALSEIAKMFGH